MKSFTVITQVFKQKPYLGYFLLMWFGAITIFLWLVNINLLAYIIGSPVLTAIGKLEFIATAYGNFFVLNNPITLSRLMFSILLAVNLTLLIFVWRAGKQRSGAISSNSGALAAMVGSHCIACGTSLVAPLISALAGSTAYLSAERFAVGQMLATGANILGIILVIWSIKGISKRIKTH